MFYIDKNICFRIISILSKPPPSWFVDSNMDNGNQSSFINEPVPPHSPSSFGFSAITIVSVTSSPNTAFRSFQEEICTDWGTTNTSPWPSRPSWSEISRWKPARASTTSCEDGELSKGSIVIQVVNVGTNLASTSSPGTSPTISIRSNRSVRTRMTKWLHLVRIIN